MLQAVCHFVVPAKWHSGVGAGMTLGPERTTQMIFSGIFADKNVLLNIVSSLIKDELWSNATWQWWICNNMGSHLPGVVVCIALFGQTTGIESVAIPSICTHCSLTVKIHLHVKTNSFRMSSKQLMKNKTWLTSITSVCCCCLLSDGHLTDSYLLTPSSVWVPSMKSRASFKEAWCVEACCGNLFIRVCLSQSCHLLNWVFDSLWKVQLNFVSLKNCSGKTSSQPTLMLFAKLSTSSIHHEQHQQWQWSKLVVASEVMRFSVSDDVFCTSRPLKTRQSAYLFIASKTAACVHF